jgi:hypothetical protein
VTLELSIRLAVLGLLFALAAIATPGAGYLVFLAFSVFCVTASITAAAVDYRREHRKNAP